MDEKLKIIELEQRLQLELLAQSHAGELFTLVEANRDYLREWLPWVDQMHSSVFIENFIDASHQRMDAGTELAFVIRCEEQLVGRIGIYKIDTQNKIGEIGYWLGKNQQGKGIITKSCRKILELAFIQLSLNRIEIKCATENLRSQKTPERLGFKFEGILREAEKHIINYVDLKLYSLLKKEWLQNQE